LGKSDGNENAGQRAVTAAVPITGKSGCQYKVYDTMYFYGSIIKVQKDVADVDQCIAQCWKFVVGGVRRCQAVNYLKIKKICEMMTTPFNVTDRILMKYFGDKNPNASYGIPVSCPTEGQGGTGGGEESKANCGQTSIDPMARSTTRIINGTEAKKHSIPWIVSLRQGFSSKRHFCGGTLVRVNDGDETDIVITAAHCNEPGLEPDMVDIVAGAHELTNQAEGEQTVEYEDWVNHEDFDPKTLENDISVMKLAKPIKFGKTTQPACLPQAGEKLPEGTPGLVAGWGNTEEGSKQALKLQQLIVPVIPNTKCGEYYKKAEPPKTINEKIMLCAGYHEGGRDACQGDSGGPLTFKSAKGSYTLQGVVSFGKGCARAEMPGVYARVSNYIDWINAKIKKMSALAKN